MTKQEEFLWMVQTVILANGIDLARQQEPAWKYHHILNSYAVLGIASTALKASRFIPPEMSASDAAADFCFYMLDNMRSSTEAADGRGMACPAWFRGLHDRK